MSKRPCLQNPVAHYLSVLFQPKENYLSFKNSHLEVLRALLCLRALCSLIYLLPIFDENVLCSQESPLPPKATSHRLNLINECQLEDERWEAKRSPLSNRSPDKIVLTFHLLFLCKKTLRCIVSKVIEIIRRERKKGRRWLWQ